MDALLTEAALRRLAGPTYYARGESYLAGGAVKNLRIQAGHITASVDGTHRYAVRIWATGGQLDWTCSCPLGEEGEACKHFVATGLAYLARAARADDGALPRASSVTQYLQAADKATLVRLFAERMADDPDLEAWLLLRAQRGGFKDDRAVMRVLDQALDLAGDLDHEDTLDFASRSEQAVALLEGMLDSADYHAAAQFSEYALRRGFAACDRVDDSDARVGYLLRRIAGVHRAACIKGALAGEQLADHLFALLLEDDWGVLSAADYRQALGAAGRARFAQVVREEWSKLRPLTAGSRGTDPSGKRYLLTGLMRDIAAHSDDVDQMVEVEQRDLSDATGFLRVAQILSKAKRHEEALAWAERGLAAFPRDRFGELVDFAVNAYVRRKRYDPALALRWEQFETSPRADSFDRLKRCAAAARQWPVWRERALAHLKALAANRKHRESDWGGGPSSELVEIYLTEGDLGAALEQARAGGCAAALWERLAQACEAERPEDAIGIYGSRIGGVIGRADNQAYDQATRMLRKIGQLMRQKGEATRFLDLLGKVMTAHKAKRNLMKRLEPVVAEARRMGVRGDG
jgi:uncharacterized Zn finger protein